MFRKKQKNISKVKSPTLEQMIAFKGVNYLVIGSSGDDAGTTADHRIMVDCLLGEGYELIGVGYGPQFYLKYPEQYKPPHPSAQKEKV
jgi:hypothetical protein